MKKMLVLVLSILVLTACNSQESAFKEGRHYDVLPLPASEKPVVEEFFSFYCGHCAQFAPTIAQLKQQLPAGVELKKNHVAFIGGPMGREMQLAYAASEVLMVEPKIETSLFDAIHNQKVKIRSRNHIKAIFEQNGVAGKDYEASLTSFVVIGMADTMEKKAKEYKINSVPTVIINGKYKVKRDSVKSTAEYNALVNYLVTQK